MEVSGKRQDNKGKSSDGDGNILCQPCSQGDESEVAIGYCKNCNEYMCAVCLKVHRRQAMSRNHTILDGDNMPKMTLPKVSLNACSDICPKHVNEIIKYYCSLHDMVCCGDCMIIDHKLCKAARIPDISTKYFNVMEHQDILKRLEQFTRSLDKVNKDLQATEKNITKSCENAIKDVRAFKKELIDYLDKAETEMLEMITKRKQRDQSLLLNVKLLGKCLDYDIKETQTKLQLQQNKANILFVKAKQVKVKLCSIEEDIEKLKRAVNIDLFEFRRSSHISQVIDADIKLGDMSKVRRPAASNEECVLSLNCNDISTLNAYFDCEIDMTLQDDVSDCCVLDCELLSQNKLVVADNGNECIKIVDVKNRTVSKYKLRNVPFGVAVVNTNLIAVTLPVEDKIQFLAITADNKITEMSMIKVDSSFTKIAIFEDKIIGITNTSIEIISITGQKIKSISHPKLSWLMDIAVVRGSEMFYASSSSMARENRGVYKLDSNGNLISTYTDKELVDVRGLEITRDGTLLVCNWDEDGSIYMITPDCKKIKVLLKQNEHVSNQRCVAFCDETNKLYLANNERLLGKKMNNVLKVFQLK